MVLKQLIPRQLQKNALKSYNNLLRVQSTKRSSNSMDVKFKLIKHISNSIPNIWSDIIFILYYCSLFNSTKQLFLVFIKLPLLISPVQNWSSSKYTRMCNQPLQSCPLHHLCDPPSTGGCTLITQKDAPQMTGKLNIQVSAPVCHTTHTFPGLKWGRNSLLNLAACVMTDVHRAATRRDLSLLLLKVLILHRAWGHPPIFTSVCSNLDVILWLDTSETLVC